MYTHEKTGYYQRNDRTTSHPTQASIPDRLKTFNALEILEEIHKNNLE